MDNLARKGYTVKSQTVAVVGGGTLPRQERERRFLSEYLLESCPDMQYQLNVELGPIPPEYIARHGLHKAAAMFRPTRPRVDAVRWTDDTYTLIEAKIRDLKIGVGDLVYYRALLPATPDLPFHDGQPIRCLLVVPWQLEWLQWVAGELHIDTAVFTPDWIADYVAEKQHYLTAEWRRERAEKMRLRKILGVE